MTLTEIKELVTMRLATFGYVVKTTDSAIISYVAEEAAQHVCNYCHFKACPGDIPGALKFVVSDYAVGTFLQHKKTFAPSDLTMFDLDSVVKSITTGDTRTEFAVGDASQTPEQRLDSIINLLKNGGKSELNAHRRVAW